MCIEFSHTLISGYSRVHQKMICLEYTHYSKGLNFCNVITASFVTLTWVYMLGYITKSCGGGGGGGYDRLVQVANQYDNSIVNDNQMFQVIQCQLNTVEIQLISEIFIF